jgi:hypothetical protein
MMIISNQGEHGDWAPYIRVNRGVDIPYIKRYKGKWVGDTSPTASLPHAYIYMSEFSRYSGGEIHLLELDSEGWLTLPVGGCDAIR